MIDGRSAELGGWNFSGVLADHGTHRVHQMWLDLSQGNGVRRKRLVEAVWTR
jgi:hypothetical protein